MQITSYKTPKIVAGDKLFDILDQNLPKISEKSVVVVTSKIVAICEGRLIADDGRHNKQSLSKQESQWYFRNDQTSRYDVTLTINNDTLIANAGVDHSNGNGNFVIWPINPMESAKNIWSHVREKNNLDQVGVIITDSHLTPLRWGTQGFGLSWCGFTPLNSYIGKPDIFGLPLKSTKLSVLDGLAAGAVVLMGDGSEQTPLAVIEEVPFVEFKTSPPTQQEIEGMKISLEDDMYAPLLTSINWEKGGGR